jgi:hypothetical protein
MSINVRPCLVWLLLKCFFEETEALEKEPLFRLV